MFDTNKANFAVLTLRIDTLEIKESRKGEPYAIAQAALPMGEGRPEMPFRLIVTNRLTTVLSAGKTFTLLGTLGYEEREDQAVYLFFPYKYQKADRPRNFVKLTLRAGQDAEGRYSAAGNFWARVRAAYHQGKDPEGNWKSSLWLNVKAFSREGEDSLALRISELQKGQRIHITGHLVYDVFEGRPYLDLIASRATLAADEPEEEALAGEPG